MTLKRKIKILAMVLFVGSVANGLVYSGWWLHEKYDKPKVEIRVISAIRLVEYDDPEVFEGAVRQASEKYGIRKEVFYAIRSCEGGHLWAWNKTNDGGYFQINWKTAKMYGAKDLSDLINPYKSAELTAKIIQKEGIKPWVTQKCIVEKLIKTGKGLPEKSGE